MVVVGAGAFGGWTALHMLRKGFDVTLVDQYGPGNSQASSGGETRLTRAYYDDPIYFTMALRSMDLWRENEPLMGQKILHQNGLLLFNYAAETKETKAAVPIYQKAGLPLERLSVEDACKRWPQIGTKNLNHIIYDPTAGYLEARKGCKAVCDLFIKEGGVFLQQQVKTFAWKGSKLPGVTLSDGTKLEADIFVFACGPWLVRLFPELLSKLIVTRALCFFFASPPGQADLMENKLPTWMDRVPTPEERLQYPRIVYFQGNARTPAFQTEINAPIGSWLRKSIRQAFAQEPVMIRMMGGTVPVVPMIQTLNIPAVIVPLVNMDNNQHSPNENLRIGNLRTGIKTCLSILTTSL